MTEKRKTAKPIEPEPEKGSPIQPHPRPPDPPEEPPRPAPPGVPPPPTPEPGLSISALVAKLITDIQTGIQVALVQQVETTSRELEALGTLPDELLMAHLVPAEEVFLELQRLFPTPEKSGLPTGISAGAPYTPAVPEKGQEENPALKKLLGYEVKPGDVRADRITPDGERRIIEHFRKKRAEERKEALQEVYRRGVPYVLVDHGKITVKLAGYGPSQLPSRTQQPSLERSAQFSGVEMPLPTFKVRLVNERNIEALGREGGAIGELEISFKVDLR